MSAIFESSSTVSLEPRPGFVIKTKIVEGSGDHIYLTKVFINVCHDARVPKPAGGFELSEVFAKIVRNEWEIPIIVSLEKKATDKKGVPSFVYDCCINSECFQWIQVSKDLRMILVEWCLESVEMMHDLVLEREYSLPKMVCKGELSHTEITQEDLKNGLQKKLFELKQNETAGLIEELRAGDEPAGDAHEHLPELTNISGTRPRPLIEEIDSPALPSVAQGVPGDLASSGPRATQGKDDASKSPYQPADSTSHESSGKTQYRFTVTQKAVGTDFYIVFESQQLTQNVRVTFHEAEEHIRIQNLDATRKLGTEDYLELPVPLPYQPYRSFLLMNERKLYVFCRYGHAKEEVDPIPG